MHLSIRPAEFTLPSFSLTGDLLGFQRCGLQYRYTRIGQLPASRPVQMWFGRFIHGVLEESYRDYDLKRREGLDDLPPWPDERVNAICDLIRRRLAAERLFPWDEDLETLGNARAKVAINELGPELFPLIHRAEVRLTGTRGLPSSKIPTYLRFREADRYEMVGIIDVITHLELSDPSLSKNRLLKLVLSQLPKDPPEQFEVIIDYKGMRRPPVNPDTSSGPSYWDIYGWQVQTYAHLRSTHEDSLPVVAGIIIYLNELLPMKEDIVSMRKEVQAGSTDVVPTEGSIAYTSLTSWRTKDDPPELPLDFRLARAIRVEPVSNSTITTALREFDNVVARIEICRGTELLHGRVLSSWEKNPADVDTCKRCDSRTFCPSYEQEAVPQLPGRRI